MKKLMVASLIISGLLLTSCYKEPENGIAKITIVNSPGLFRQPGADVHLFGPAGSYIDVHGITDFKGEFVYEHDPALEVILTVKATYTDGAGLHEANGIVRITPDKTADETFVLYP